MSEHHDGHNHCGHNHHHEEVGGLGKREKLRKLLDHWQHHNEDHAQSFEEWEKIAKEEGLGEVGQALRNAASMTRRINRELARALVAMEE